MSFQRIVQNVFFEPWQIQPTAHYSIQKVVLSRLAGVKSDMLDEFITPSATYYVEDGIGFVPLQGIMGRKLSSMETKCGGCDTVQVANTIGTAVTDPKVKAIMILADTPGGMTQGTPELANAIARADEIKPVFTFVDGTLASAGVHATAASRQIYATSSSMIGSVGTYMAVLDSSAAYDQAGLKVELFVGDDAPYKATGFPGLPLTDDQKAYLQSSVDEANAKFKNWVSEYRPQISEDSMQGQVFWADSALDAGFIDAVTDLDQAIEDLKTVAEM